MLGLLKVIDRLDLALKLINGPLAKFWILRYVASLFAIAVKGN